MTRARRRTREAEASRRSPTPVLSGLAGAAVCAYWLPGAAAVCRPLRSALGVRDRLDAAGQVLLTFDDGPHPQATPAVLELLREAAVQATFFLVGEQVERRPQPPKSPPPATRSRFTAIATAASCA